MIKTFDQGPKWLNCVRFNMNKYLLFLLVQHDFLAMQKGIERELELIEETMMSCKGEEGRVFKLCFEIQRTSGMRNSPLSKSLETGARMGACLVIGSFGSARD